jgi:cytochrome c oxidase subunit 4
METGARKHPNYMGIWAVLAILTVAEVLVALLSHIPKNVLIIALVLLAIWKAALVAMYFMHLKFERLRVIILALAPLPLAFIFVLAVLTEYVW